MYRFDDGTARRRHSQVIAAVGAVVVVAGLVAAAYLIGPTVGQRELAAVPATPAPSSGPAPVTGRPGRAGTGPSSVAVALDPPADAVASDDPVRSAQAWLHALRSVHHDDPTPTAWIDRIRPVITDRLATSYQRLHDRSPGAQWAQFVQQRCVATVDDLDGVIPAEAPRTQRSVNVQVVGNLHTRCAEQDDPADPDARPDEPLAATLTLLKGTDGRWRVDERLF